MTALSEIHEEYMTDVQAMRKALNAKVLKLQEAHIGISNARNECEHLKLKLEAARSEIERLRTRAGFCP